MEEWRRRHAGWTPEPFAQVVVTAGATLSSALGDDPGHDVTVTAYLRLVAEALRLGYVDRATWAPTESGAPPASNLLDRCLLEVIPRRLPTYPPERRLGILADTWNLGEGLLAQPPWMARIASALLEDFDDLENLARSVALALEPLVAEPPGASSFGGPFAVHMVDLRTVEDEFLPGAMHRAAPAVLCVHDRVRAGLHAAVALGREGTSRTLGITPCLHGDGPGEVAPVDVRTGPNLARIGGRDVALPTLRVVHAHVAVAAGFVAISAVDSQRLWVVESAS